MGRDQRSRRRVPPGTICYLCGAVIQAGAEWDRDHVPPERFFAHSLKTRFNPQLAWLYTHRACNARYRGDEEYFVVALAGHAASAVGTEVMRDVWRGLQKGHGHGLMRHIAGQFSRVEASDGSRLFRLDAERAFRIAWKLIRGVFFQWTGRFLHEDHTKRLFLITPAEAETRLAELHWFPILRDTESLADYPAVFDFKWLGWPHDGIRAHVFGMALWDGIIVLALFHDPGCECPGCRPDR